MNLQHQPIRTPRREWKTKKHDKNADPYAFLFWLSLWAFSFASYISFCLFLASFQVRVSVSQWGRCVAFLNCHANAFSKRPVTLMNYGGDKTQHVHEELVNFVLCRPVARQTCHIDETSAQHRRKRQCWLGCDSVQQQKQQQLLLDDACSPDRWMREFRAVNTTTQIASMAEFPINKFVFFFKAYLKKGFENAI